MDVIDNIEVTKWESIWSQASGGKNVAASPGASGDTIPIGPGAPGLDEALAWMSEGIRSLDVQRMLFLVGGPGAGKSHAAKRLTADLNEVEPRHDGLAHRSYRYGAGDRNLLVVNDATITAGRSGKATLSGDILEALSKGDHLLACVNRGVIVEEENDGRASSDGAADAVLSWISRGTIASGDGFELNAGASTSEFGRTSRLSTEAGTVDLLCLYLDTASLLEALPLVSIEQTHEGVSLLPTQRYRVCHFTERASLSPSAVPGRVLADRVLNMDLDASCFGHDEWNPVAANLSSLAHPDLLDSVLSVMRAGEIISGQRFTYRELWGAIIRLLVGSLADKLPMNDAREEVLARGAVGTTPLERFESMTRLAEHRFSEAIFGVGDVDWGASPVCRITRMADPSRDATPGRLSKEPRTGWAQPVVDAFAVSETGESPLKALLDSDLGDGDNFPLAVTTFDRWVDAIYREARDADDTSDAQREACVIWYGGYLLRLYAVSNGIPAFRREVDQWSLLWFSSNNLPDELKAPMRTLLLPGKEPGNQNSSFLLPLFDSRANPIQGRTASPKFALKGARFGIRPVTNGDEAELVLSQEGVEVGRIYCDFQLVREALACAHDHLGISEYSHLVSPRLERLRAAQLTSKNLGEADLYVVSEHQEYAIAVEEP